MRLNSAKWACRFTDWRQHTWDGNKIYEIKKSVILEMGKNLGTKSGQIKAEATEQANKKSDKK